MSFKIFLSFLRDTTLNIKSIIEIKIHTNVVKSGKPNFRVIDVKWPQSNITLDMVLEYVGSIIIKVEKNLSIEEIKKLLLELVEPPIKT